MIRRRWRRLVAGVGIALALGLPATAATAAQPAATPLPAVPGAEAEPNESPALASPMQSGERVRANLPLGDVDYYRFTAQAGDRVFANTVTAGSTGGTDTMLSLLDGDGLRIAEDDNDGSQLGKASSIAGAEIPSTGTYYLAVTNAGSNAISSYDLYLQLHTGTPTPEVEPNNSFDLATPLSTGEASGEHDVAGDQDWFSIQLQAGDTVFLSLDLEGDAAKAQLGLGFVGDTKKGVLAVPAPGEALDDPAPSEALTMTVATAGTYYVNVASVEDSSTAVWRYDLSATVVAAVPQSCRTYASGRGALIDGGTVAFPITVPDATAISRAAVDLDLDESVMADLDVFIRNPAGVDLPLFNDIGATAPGEQASMEARFDDYAAVPSQYKSLRPLGLQPSGAGRLGLLVNQQTLGTWNLVVKDDELNQSVGMLRAARLIFCGPETPIPPPPPPDPGSGSGSGTNNNGAASRSAARTAPSLAGLGISPDRFRAAKAGPMLLAKRPAADGTLISFQSSESTQVNFVLSEANAGRQAGGKCARPTKANASKKPCTRWVKVISFIRDSAAGVNRFGFSGRVGARKLPPGEYQLQARAYSTGAQTSDPITALFTVLPPASAK